VTAHGWSTPADIRAELVRRWERGRFLAEVAEPGELFPLRIGLKRPMSPELGTRYEEVRAWARGLGTVTQARLETREVNHRQLGANSIPVAVWFDTVDAAAAVIGKTRDLARFRALLELTAATYPELVPVLARRPMDALVEAEVWPRLLDVAAWVRDHPRPGIYVRQVDVAGVHTKLIEQHLRTLAAMLDIVLPETAVDHHAGPTDFARRYGFRVRPRMVRFRYLDPRLGLRPADVDRHYTLTAADFGQVDPPTRVFMTENEINFLAFPDVAGSMVVFGAGSGLEHLSAVPWLAGVPVHYWGDIDTHGLAILDQLRAVAPHATSLMMDSETLLAHRDYWGVEDKPTMRDLHLLTAAELALYDDLRDNRLQPNLRLEQERIRFGWVRAAVAAACAR
jgi:hypothetical protein